MITLFRRVLFCFCTGKPSQNIFNNPAFLAQGSMPCFCSLLTRQPKYTPPPPLLDVEVKRLIASNPPSLPPPPTIRPNAERVCELLHSAGVHNCRLGKQRQRPTKKASLSYIISRHTQLGRQPSLPTVPFRLLR